MSRESRRAQLPMTNILLYPGSSSSLFKIRLPPFSPSPDNLVTLVAFDLLLSGPERAAPVQISALDLITR